MLCLLIPCLCRRSTLPPALFRRLAKHDSHFIAHSIVSTVDTIIGATLFFVFPLKAI